MWQTAVSYTHLIETMPGYLPSLWQPAPEEMADAVKALAGEKTVYEVRPEEHSGGSTDVGDVHLPHLWILRCVPPV